MLHPDRTDGELPRFEGWETLEKLGEGGMCAVYRARPAGGGPERAVKVLTDRSEASVRRFNEEARLLQRIDHPNVVKVHAITPTPRPPWLVMDLLGGRDLEATMLVEGPMDPERAARMFADLASGLGAVHAAGVRHRDIKPANIRLGSDGVPRLIDFGIARDAETERVTRTGFVVGTASYLPPEIFVEEDTSAVQDTEAADVYALGQTLCEVLAGRPVHNGRQKGTEATLLVRIMRDKLDREHLDPRDFGARVPEGLAAVVRKATAREPEDRLRTAPDLERDLRAFLATRTAAVAAPVSRMGDSVLPPVPLLPPELLPGGPGFPPPPPPFKTATPAPAPRAADAAAPTQLTRTPPAGSPRTPPAGTGRTPAPSPPRSAGRTPAPAPSRTPAPAPSRTPDPAKPARTPPPSPPRARTATPAPAHREAGPGGAVAATAAVAGVGAMGVAGAALAAIGVLAFLVLAGVAFVIRDRYRAADTVLSEVSRLEAPLAGCRAPRGPDRVGVHLVVDDGRTTSAEVRTPNVPERVSRCVEGVFREATWSARGHVSVDVPVLFDARGP